MFRIKKKRYPQFFLFFFYFVCASITTHLYFDEAGDYLGLQTDLLVKGQHCRPFVYRLLTYKTIQYTIKLLPEKVKFRLNHSSKDNSPRKLKAMKRYFWSGESGEIFIISYLMVFIISLTVLYILRKALMTTNHSPPVCDISPAIGLLFLPMLFSKSGYIYDFPELLFFTLGFYFVQTKRWKSYYLTYLLAVVNKETAVLMGAYFIPLLLRKNYRLFIRHTLIHAFTGLPILFVIRWMMRHYIKDFITFRLGINLSFFLTPEPWLKFTDIYAFQISTPRGFNIIVMFLLIYPIWKFRKLLDRDNLIILITILVILFPLFLVLGNRDEVRVFVPAAPIFFMLYVDAIKAMFSRHYQKDSAYTRPSEEKSIISAQTLD